MRYSLDSLIKILFDTQYTGGIFCLMGYVAINVWIPQSCYNHLPCLHVKIKQYKDWLICIYQDIFD